MFTRQKNLLLKMVLVGLIIVGLGGFVTFQVKGRNQTNFFSGRCPFIPGLECKWAAECGVSQFATSTEGLLAAQNPKIPAASPISAEKAIKPPTIISAGCRTSKVRVAKLYLGRPNAHWPMPQLDLKEEVQRYEAEFTRMAKEFADVDFFVNELITSTEQVSQIKDKLIDADGILVIQLTIWTGDDLREILSVGRPTMLFAVPYSGHEWHLFGRLMKQKEGALLDCILSSDYNELAAAVRPFRAIHHLREAKIVDVTQRQLPADYVKAVKKKFGTEIVNIGREEMLEAYNAIPDEQAKAEARRWIKQSKKVVEPSEDEILRSCKLALAMQKVLDDMNATVITVDCYGTMWRQLPAYPCIGFARLNNFGLGGVCESDLKGCMTHIILQSLSGKPGFINDPTIDVSRNAIILAHCLGTPKMDGPDGKAAPYKLRSIMERQEGACPQVGMRIGQRVTTAVLLGTTRMLYFTGEIIDTPDLPRGCRTKITVKVDGDIEKLWRNWGGLHGDPWGLHRVACYGDLTKDLQRFCRFMGIELVNEAQ